MRRPPHPLTSIPTRGPARIRARGMARVLTRVVAPAMAGILLLPACSSGGGGDTGVLQQNLDAQNAALDALRDRVSDLIDRLDTAEARDPITDLNNLSSQVATIDEAVTALQTELSALTSADEDASASLEAEFGALKELVNELVASLQDATRRIGDLEDEVADLRQQLETHVADNNRHK